jgi:hypothetical protein
MKIQVAQKMTCLDCIGKGQQEVKWDAHPEGTRQALNTAVWQFPTKFQQMIGASEVHLQLPRTAMLFRVSLPQVNYNVVLAGNPI